MSVAVLISPVCTPHFVQLWLYVPLSIRLCSAFCIAWIRPEFFAIGTRRCVYRIRDLDVWLEPRRVRRPRRDDKPVRATRVDERSTL